METKMHVQQGHSNCTENNTQMGKAQFEYLGIRDPGKIKRVKKELAGKFGL